MNIVQSEDINENKTYNKVILSRSQCACTENPCPGHNSSLQTLSWIWIIFHTLFMIQGSAMTLGSGHILNVKVTVHTYPKSVSWP